MALNSGSKTVLKKISYVPILIVFFMYSIAFSMTFPALPKLLLTFTHDDSTMASDYFGAVTTLKFLLEFFSGPFLGSLSDRIGRRPILLFSLFALVIEMFLLALLPSIAIIFLSRAMSGMFDATVAIVYAAVSDIAFANDDFVTKNFGSISAIFSLSVVIGPLLGVYLCRTSISLCFMVAGGILIFSLLFCYCFVAETRPHKPTTKPQNTMSIDIFSAVDKKQDDKIDSEDISFCPNPFAPFKSFFCNSELRVLSYPFILAHLSSGIHYVWMLYLKERFSASFMDVGLFLAITGASVMIAQGLLIKNVVPDLFSEETTATICMCFTSIQLLCFGNSTLPTSLNLFWPTTFSNLPF